MMKARAISCRLVEDIFCKSDEANVQNDVKIMRKTRMAIQPCPYIARCQERTCGEQSSRRVDKH